jgi:hypothetical protein
MTYSGIHYNFSPNSAIIRDKENSVVIAIIPAYNESHNIQKITTETSESILL